MELITMYLTEEQKQSIIKQGVYNYLGWKVIEASIDTSTLEKKFGKIVWTPSNINQGKVCKYTATLENKQGVQQYVKGRLFIQQIVDTGKVNPSLVLQDLDTKIVAGIDLEIQTSNFLNQQKSVVSKVLGCTVFNREERQTLFRCDKPPIVNYHNIYPTIYCIKSNESIYVGITHRDLCQRLSEHCIYKQDSNKTTYDMLSQEGAKMYCIGEFTDYTLAELECLSVEERDKFHSKMEFVETMVITLAYQQFPDLELVNRKQILTTENKVVKHIAKQSFINVEMYFNVLKQIGFRLPCGLGKARSFYLDYASSSWRYYTPLAYYRKFKSTVGKYLEESCLVDYAILYYLLLPHTDLEESIKYLDKVVKEMC